MSEESDESHASTAGATGLEDQILKALEKDSDFSFEMSVLYQLHCLGFAVEHSGSYVDPVRAKHREFDIRALKVYSDTARLHMAVECKNISASPLIIHRAPRRRNEAFHHILNKPNVAGQLSVAGKDYTPTESRVIDCTHSPYRLNEPVGKAMDQAVRDGKGRLKLSDGEIFDKYSQALSSLSDLVERVASASQPRGDHALLAMLVVPNGSLWVRDYSETGVEGEKPISVDHVQYFVNKSYPFYSYPRDGHFVLSHLEIVTTAGILPLLDRYCVRWAKFEPLFPAN